MKFFRKNMFILLIAFVFSFGFLSSNVQAASEKKLSAKESSKLASEIKKIEKEYKKLVSDSTSIKKQAAISIKELDNVVVLLEETQSTTEEDLSEVIEILKEARIDYVEIVKEIDAPIKGVNKKISSLKKTYKKQSYSKSMKSVKTIKKALKEEFDYNIIVDEAITVLKESLIEIKAEIETL